MDEKQLQKAFALFLVLKSGAKSEQELKDYVQKLGKDGLLKLYNEFMSQMKLQQVKAARHGAKLNYIRSIAGDCAEDEELTLYKVGGKICKKCLKKRLEGGAIPYTPIESACGGTKVIKEFKAACGGKAKKKTKKGEGGMVLNPYDTESMKCGGKKKAKLVKKNYNGALLDKCGGKAKKKK